MKTKRLRKIHIAALALAVCFLLPLVLIRSTYAYYSSMGSLRNTLTTTDSSIYLRELFYPKDQWLPGETKTKEVNFGNGGESSQVIRFRVETQWRDSSNTDWVPLEESPVEINWTESRAKDWTKILSADGKEWYYYDYVLLTGDETPVVMDSVVFSQSLSNDSYAEDFTNTTCRVVVYLESLMVNTEIAGAEWGVTFEGEGALTWWELP